MKSTTKIIHSRNGQYTEERQKLHSKIIFEIINFSPVKNPTAILMGGGTASGKSFIGEMFINAYKQENRAITYIDSDNIKNYIPEYNEMLDSGNEYVIREAAAFVHDESSDIAKIILEISIDKKIEFIYDGTMKNTEKYQKIIEKLQQSYYTVQGVIVDVPLHVAFERAEIRFETEGRKVPDDEIIASHKGVVRTFMLIQDQFDSFVIYDNTDKPVTPFVEKESRESEVNVIDEQRLLEFYSKNELSEYSNNK